MTRLAADLTSVRLYVSEIQSGLTQERTVDVTPAFVGGQFTYAITVPFIRTNVSLVPEYITSSVPPYYTASRVTVDSGAIGTGAVVNTQTQSQFFAINQGINYFHICVDNDGNYTYIVT